MSNKFILIDPDKEELRDQSIALAVYLAVLCGFGLMSAGLIWLIAAVI